MVSKFNQQELYHLYLKGELEFKEEIVKIIKDYENGIYVFEYGRVE